MAWKLNNKLIISFEKLFFIMILFEKVQHVAVPELQNDCQDQLTSVKLTEEWNNKFNIICSAVSSYRAYHKLPKIIKRKKTEHKLPESSATPMQLAAIRAERIALKGVNCKRKIDSKEATKPAESVEKKPRLDIDNAALDAANALLMLSDEQHIIKLPPAMQKNITEAQHEIQEKHYQQKPGLEVWWVNPLTKISMNLDIGPD